jgi:hypothetical protein
MLSLPILILSGCGGATVIGAAAGALRISPGNVTFGSVTVGNVAVSTISLVNSGAAPVTISSLSIAGKSFALSSQASLPITLAASGGSYSLSVKFNPSASGAATGQLAVASDAAGDGTTMVGLSGTGVTASVATTPAPPTVSNIQCSNAVTGPGTDSCSVTLTAAAPDGGTVVTLASSNAAISVPASTTVAAGATSANFVATVSSATGFQQVVLTASAGGATANFAIEVEVANPALTVSAVSMAFGNKAVNTPTSQTLTLTSTGAATVSITSATLSGAGFSLPGASFPITLTPGQSTSITVQFDPTTAGAVAGQLILATDSSGGAPTVALSGTGIAALTNFKCATLSFTGAGTDACTVTLNAPAAAGGYAVNLSSTSAAMAVPSSVTVAAGSSTASFSATVSSVTSVQTATLSASVGGSQLTVNVQLKAAVANLSVGTSSLNFGSVAVNTATTQTVTLSSTGTQSVTVTSATISGLGFSITGASLPLTLGPDQTASLTVQFDPSVAGAATGQLTLLTNSSSGGSIAVALSGAGVPVLTSLACAKASITGSGTDTCTVALNAAAATGGLTVGLSSSNSAVSVPSSVTVGAGAASASFAATVSSVSTAQAVTLSAMAGSVSKTFALQLNAGSGGALNINATNIAFGDVNLNTPATQTITLTSTGVLPIVVTAATVSGSGFSVSGISFPLTLSLNQSTTLNVIFNPTTSGAATGQLIVLTTSLTNPTMVVSLSGTGLSVGYEVNLSWNAPASSTDPVAGYNVYRTPSGSSTYQLLGSVNSSQLTYTDTNSILNGQTYDYIVESVDASGNESSPSNMAAVSIPN